MAPPDRITRRAVLRMGAGLACGLSGSAGRSLARTSPNDRINVGFLGAGGIANSHLGPLLAQPDVRIVAVCDVNAQRREAMVAAVNQHYQGGVCGAYGDFRQVLARSDVDAVLVATPDHWHALMVIAAARAGKGIYSEKPFSRTVAEGRAMVQAVRSAGVAFQHGTQQRSDAWFRQACELVRCGRIGRVHTVRVAAPGGWQSGAAHPEPAPGWLDWEMWLGPAPWAPYSPERYQNAYWWHIEDYSAGGFISGWGVHHVDIAQWGLGKDLTGPSEISGAAVFPSSGLCDAPITWRVEYTYPGVRVLFTTPDQARFGITFEGTDGSVFVNRGEYETKPASLIRDLSRPEEVHLYRSADHHRNWLDCIREHRPTVAPPEVGHRSQTICCLSDIAVRLGRKLRWDPVAETVLGDPVANRMLGRAMRSPWVL